MLCACRVAAYAEKKAKKPALIAKSNIILDVKPWDDETDMEALEASVRSITMDGLLWGASKFVPVGYGIRKLQISCVVEDDKVSTDDLEDQICAFEDYVSKPIKLCSHCWQFERFDILEFSFLSPTIQHFSFIKQNQSDVYFIHV